LVTASSQVCLYGEQEGVGSLVSDPTRSTPCLEISSVNSAKNERGREQTRNKPYWFLLARDRPAKEMRAFSFQPRFGLPFTWLLQLTSLAFCLREEVSWLL